MLLGISSITGGRSSRGMREVAAASGGSTPKSIATSGYAARGGVCAGPVSSLLVVSDTEIVSRKESVIYQFLFKAQQGTQRSSLDAIALR